VTIKRDTSSFTNSTYSIDAGLITIWRITKTYSDGGKATTTTTEYTIRKNSLQEEFHLTGPQFDSLAAAIKEMESAS
jgi:hypothetical protein